MDHSIAEYFLIIAHHPEKGRFIATDVHLNYGLIGALMLDLMLGKWYTLDGKLLMLSSQKTSTNEIYEDMLTQIRKSEKPKKIQRWISKFSNRSRKYKWEIIASLEKQNILKIEHKKFLFIPYRLTYLTNQNFREKILQDLAYKVLSSKKLNEEEVSILSLVEACKLQKTLSNDKQEQKVIKTELKMLLKGSPIASAIDATIKQIQIAIAASIAASAAASTAAR